MWRPGDRPQAYVTRVRQSQHANWLPNEPGTTSMTVYEIFADWDRETKGWFGIERLDTRGLAPPVLTPEEMAKRLHSAVDTLTAKFKYWQQLAARLMTTSPANQAGDPWRHHVSSLDSWFCSGKWELENDQALLLELRPPREARYWGLCAYDPSSEPLDYVDRHGTLNCAQAAADHDGLVRALIALQDPGVANWLDVSGHPEGIFAWRVTSGAVQPQQPRARVVQLADVGGVLPPETRRMDAAERREVLARRQRHLQYRNSL